MGKPGETPTLTLCVTYLEEDFRMPVRRIVKAKDRQRTDDVNSRAGHRNQNHALLLVRGCRGVALAHEDADLAAGVWSPRSPPLVAIQHVRVIFPAPAVAETSS